jgi:hypothetical protein
LKALKLLPEFTYHDARAQTLTPLSRSLTSIIRLYLIDDIAHLSSKAEADKLIKFFGECQLPSFWPQLFGPKIVSRPGELSPGEYETIHLVLPLHYMSLSMSKEQDSDSAASVTAKQKYERWEDLSIVWKGVRS